MGTIPNDEDIIRELLQLAATDQTDPPEWALDLELRRLEKAIVHEDKDPTRFAYVCCEAYTKTETPTSKSLFELGWMNGERRKNPCATWTVHLLIDKARGEIEALEPSARRTRLSELLFYHTAIFARNEGQYVLAAEMQKKAADEAEKAGNNGGAAIARFSEKVELVNQALLEGSGAQDLLAELVLAGQNLPTLIPKESPEFVRWVHFNGPVHRLVGHFLAGEASSSTDHADGKHLDQLYNLDFVFVKQQEGIYFLAFAIQAYGRGDYCCSYALARAAVMANAPVEYAITTHILLAELALERDDEETAKAELMTALSVSQSGGHQARAVASRILGALDSSPT